LVSVDTVGRGIVVDSYYANLLAYRVSANELVLEFGNFFAGQDNRSQADFQDFEIRIVMVPDLIEPFINLLEQAKAARDQQRKLFDQTKKEVDNARAQ
jgi:hypothetical protein